MSAIGPASFNAINLAGSVAGSQQNNASEDRVKEAGADRKFQLDQKAMATSSTEDVAETDLETDRDADGRQLYDFDEHEASQEHESIEDNHPGRKRVRTPDAFEERGLSLDIEA